MDGQCHFILTRGANCSRRLGLPLHRVLDIEPAIDPSILPAELRKFASSLCLPSWDEAAAMFTAPTMR